MYSEFLIKIHLQIKSSLIILQSPLLEQEHINKKQQQNFINNSQQTQRIEKLSSNQYMHPEHQSKQTWVNDTANKKYSQLKNHFLTTLQEQAKDGKIGYYDFLLVAKKLSFRFQESSHLMALKNFFSKNKNLLTCKKLADSLSVSHSSLLPSSNQEKVIVKFNVPDAHFAPIKEETLEDQDFDDERSMREQGDYEDQGFQKMGEHINQDHQRQLMQKMAIILSIKVQQMQRKLLILTRSSSIYSIFTYFDQIEEFEINYELFKKGVVDIISTHKQKIKLSEDDVKTIFHLLDEEKYGFITKKQIEKLRNLQESGIIQKMKEFYKSRLNKEMVKNTLFKLGKVKSNSIQIYQLKNASILQFKQIEEAIVNHHDIPLKNRFNIRVNRDSKQKSRIPHFGPLKGAAKWKNKQRQAQSQPHYNHLYASTHPINNTGSLFSINKERQKIEKILKQYKDPNSNKTSGRSEKNGQTVASKLRSLFIHKVILPRQKMLEEEKERFLKSKIPQNQLWVKPLK